MSRRTKTWPCLICERLYAECEEAEVCERSHQEPTHERERNEDDGQEYGHPADRLAGRE